MCAGRSGSVRPRAARIRAWARTIMLLRLGDAMFLEVIAPDPQAVSPRPRWFALDTLGPGSAPALSGLGRADRRHPGHGGRVARTARRHRADAARRARLADHDPGRRQPAARRRRPGADRMADRRPSCRPAGRSITACRSCGWRSSIPNRRASSACSRRSASRDRCRSHRRRPGSPRGWGAWIDTPDGVRSL